MMCEGARTFDFLTKQRAHPRANASNPLRCDVAHATLNATAAAPLLPSRPRTRWSWGRAGGGTAGEGEVARSRAELPRNPGTKPGRHRRPAQCELGYSTSVTGPCFRPTPARPPAGAQWQSNTRPERRVRPRAPALQILGWGGRQGVPSASDLCSQLVGNSGIYPVKFTG